MKIIFLSGAGAVIVLATITYILFAARFDARLRDLKLGLISSQGSQRPPEQSLIPDLVRRFSENNGGRLNGPKAVYIRQSAEMRLRADQPYFHINASQVSGTRRPGFIWDARGRLFGILPLRVVDSFVLHAGWLEARILGMFKVASAKGPEIDRGEAFRYLAELAWNPDALINAHGLVWKQIDDFTIRVEMDTRGGTASVSLLFDSKGDIIGIDAADRPRAVGNLNVPTRWVGRFSGYARKGDYRWPRYGEIAWVLPEGEFIYWRGEVLIVQATAFDAR